MLLAERKGASDDSPQTRMVRMLMVCCVAVFLADIPGLLLDKCLFRGARSLLFVFDTLYWLLYILYFWLKLAFADLWVWRNPAAMRRRAVWYVIPMLAGIVIILLNPWTGWLFVLDANNAYAPGAYYILCLIPQYLYFAGVLAVAVVGFRMGDEYKRRSLSLLTYILLPVCGAAMEFISYGTSWLWPMVALSLLVVYLTEQNKALMDKQLSVSKAAEKVARMDAEIAINRTAIVLSQIQPHFLYNALCVIQDLCHEKAPEAERATVAFSRFLRGNLDSLKAVTPIPFSRELSHTRYYLALESMRFGDRLQVEYDIQADDFLLPALTLQPIVENAVRYGVTKRETGGTVWITSHASEKGYTIIVQDNGIGFDPYQTHDDGRTHFGIDLVSRRLREMCGGDLSIVSRPGEGTIATMTLPKAVVA